MEVLFILIPLSLCVSLMGLLAFFWAAVEGQFEDLRRPAHDVIFDDEDAC